MNIREIDEKYQNYDLKIKKCSNCKSFRSDFENCGFDKSCFSMEFFEFDKEKYIKTIQDKIKEKRSDINFFIEHINLLETNFKEILKLLERKGE